MKNRSILLTLAALLAVCATAVAGAASSQATPSPQPNPLYHDQRPGGAVPASKAPAGPSAPALKAPSAGRTGAQSKPLIGAPPQPGKSAGSAPTAPAMNTALPEPPSQDAQTKTVADVVIPDDVNVARQRLLLNGAGVFKRWWVMKQYVAALYLGDTATSTAQVVLTPGPKRIALHMLTAMSAQDLSSNLVMALRDNSPASDIKKLHSQITHFRNLLDDVNKGDEIDFDYLPHKGVRVSIAGKVRGTVKSGAAFERALLRVWLGDEPVNTDLKQQLLAASSAPRM